LHGGGSAAEKGKSERKDGTEYRGPGGGGSEALPSLLRAPISAQEKKGRRKNAKDEGKRGVKGISHRTKRDSGDTLLKRNTARSEGKDFGGNGQILHR